MDLAYGNVGRLILGHQVGFLTVGDLGCAAHHNPVLGPVVVHLHGKLGAGLYGNSFDLVTVAVIDGVVHAPGTVDFPVVHVFVPAIVLDSCHDFLHILNLVFVGNEQGILGFDDHQVPHAHGGHQAAVSPHQCAFGVVGDHVAGEAVAVGIFITDFPEGGPRTDIAPAGV